MTDSGGSGGGRTWGVRRRVSAVAAALFVGLLAAAGGLFLMALKTGLEDNARAAAMASATEVAAAIAHHPPTSIVVARPDAVSERIVQVVDAGGRILAWSRPVAATVSLGHARPAPGQQSTRLVDTIPGVDDDPFVITEIGVRTSDGSPLTVVAAEPMHLEEDLVARLGAISAITVLALSVGAVVAVRLTMSAALRPVERARTQLAEISSAGSAESIEVPPGGDELTRLAETMNDLLDRLRTSDALRRNFVADAGHELRSPLATVSLAMERLSGDLTSADRAATSATAEAELARLKELVDDLLTLAKIDADGMPLARHTVDLDDIVLAESRVARAKGVRVELAITPVQVDGDARRLTQVVRNILDNARRHGEGDVRIALSSSDSRAVLEIDNSGAPLPVQDRGRVFERFVRLDGARSRSTGGSGLGLAIVAETVAAHGGEVRAGEAPDGWCRFTVTLPAIEADPEPATRPDPQPVGEPLSSMTR